ncbi:MAG TPA: SPFH domain-containing protein [Gemmata sp.]|nr:SPFH domain-containing protein [Gemmata sp.]
MLRLRYLLLLVLVAYLLTGITTVSPEERVVVRRFGKVVARPGPGLWVGLPWGMDRIDRVPVRSALQLTVGYNPETWSDVAGTPPGQFLTGDQNLVNVQLVLDYAIEESDAELDDYVNHRDRAEAVLDRLAEAAAAEWVAGRGVDQVLRAGNALIPATVMDRVAERLPAYHLGIRLQRVSVSYLAAPEEVRAAFEAVTQAQTAIRTRETQAQQEASQRTRQAEALKYKLEQEAEEYRESQLGQARAEATAFLGELAAFREVAKQNPDALAFLWWTEMAKALATLDARGGRVKPLDQYLQNGELNVTEFFPLPKR